MGSLQWQSIVTPGLTLTQNYGYDTVNRLTSAAESGIWSQAYGYDAGGNRSVSSTGYMLSSFTPTVQTNYNSQNQSQLLAGYDNAGNLTTQGSFMSTFDAENRMVTNTLSGSTTYYVYDGNGQRVMKQNWLGTTTYVYDAGGNLAAEYTVPASGQTLPSGVTNPCGTPTCYVTVDHLGSTRLVTDNAGNVYRRYDYLPSGEEIPIGTGGRTSAIGYQLIANGTGDGFNPKFTGQMRDTETGLDYFNARYYSPAQGRFLGVDPGNAGADLANPQTWNAYAYVGNNPMSLTDPNGTNFGDFVGGLIHDVLNAASGGLWGAFTSAIEGGSPASGAFGSLPGIGDFTGCGGPLGNCGTIGSAPWNEQAPGLGPVVQDPGRFVSDYNSFAHQNMTLGAGVNAGWSVDDANDFANRVMFVDFWRHSQDHDPVHEHWHSTAAPGESCREAYAGAVSTVRDASAKAQKGDRDAAALALHAIEDSYATGHQYQVYKGGLLPSRAHRSGDEIMAPGYSDAANAATRYLKALKGESVMQSPESYLFRPAGCK